MGKVWGLPGLFSLASVATGLVVSITEGRRGHTAFPSLRQESFQAVIDVQPQEIPQSDRGASSGRGRGEDQHVSWRNSLPFPLGVSLLEQKELGLGPGQAHFKWQLCHPLAVRP